MNFPSQGRHRGYILLLVLVALVAMMISGIALVRSMDTSQLVAGNLASRNSTIHSADWAVQQAAAWIQAQATTGVLNNDAPANGYYAEAVEEPWTSPAFWATCPGCTATDAANNTVSWVINRICNQAGIPGGAGIYCSTVNGVASNGGSYSSDAPTFNSVAAYYYRITIQVRDSRNTTTLSQAFVTM